MVREIANASGTAYNKQTFIDSGRRSEDGGAAPHERIDADDHDDRKDEGQDPGGRSGGCFGAGGGIGAIRRRRKTWPIRMDARLRGMPITMNCQTSRRVSSMASSTPG